MKDGLIFMYVKDNKIYPIAITEEQLDLLQVVGGSILNGEVKLINNPLGEAINLVNQSR